MGTRWTKLGNSSEGCSPTRCVGLSGVTSSGNCVLQVTQLALEPVVLLVRDLGAGGDVVEMLVAPDEVAQLEDAVLGRFAMLG